MKKENSGPAGFGMPPGRITRARAAAFGESDVLIPSKPPLVKSDRKQTQLGKTKRMASDENNHATSLTSAIQQKKRAVLKDVTNIEQKKRAVLKDVTNVSCRNSFKGCINAGKLQSKVSQRVKSVPSREKLCSGKEYSTSASLVSIGSALVDGNVKDKMAEEMQQVGMPESQETAVSMIAEESLLAPQKVDSIAAEESSYDTALFTDHIFREDARLIDLIKNDKNKLCEVLEDLSSLGIINIDSDHTNPQMCSLYSSDIYINLRASELIRRPCSNFMETLQRDINQSMRGILIDWLVEVSEEYRLVPDTLYLTVYIIDRYLSQNYIERHRLQLLGITCMLIASKYEEICAPRVEEFCFITDNTYTKGDVLKMEIQVLNYLGFQLSVPTIKTFLRRFLRAAQASYKVSSLGLGYLANYLAELTLVEYSFLKFVPSVIAASAVFLARWTLERSGNPWNRTLEHYTSYKASDLKATVLAMQELQMNSNKSPLNAIREKYRQAKFESVASMTSPKLLQSHFCC